MDAPPVIRRPVADILADLQRIAEHTPPGLLATRPLPRPLLIAAIAEIERLRAENAALLQRGQP